MHTRLTTHLTRAALKAARPARRHVVRALRHHSARTRALAEQWREAKPVDGIRAWFQTFFSVLRMHTGSRRFSLRRLPAAFSALTSARPAPAPRGSNRRPRRLAASASAGWFAFAAR
jgi:hypothetical protein